MSMASCENNQWWRVSHLTSRVFAVGDDYKDFVESVHAAIRHRWKFEITWHKTKEEAFWEEGIGLDSSESKEAL